MKEVEHHCGRNNSVIFQAVSKETLNEVASRFHILEHGIVPPKTDYTSSWLNLSEELYELDKGHDRLSSLVTLQPEPKVADQEVPVKEMENIHEPSNEMVKVSDEALLGGEKQSKPSEHQKSFGVKADIIAQKEQEVMIVENNCSVKEMEGQ
ncbi:solute carrier family 41 member 2-like isoform X1, partial [Clarias magur]